MITPINTGIKLTSGHGSRQLCCFTTPVHSLLMNFRSVEMVRISRFVDTFVWCCSCCIVDVSLGVAEYQTDCTWCNNFRRLRCFCNDFTLGCHVACLKIQNLRNFSHKMRAWVFIAFASNEKNSWPTEFFLNPKRSIMFHPAASIKVLALLLILCAFALRLLYLVSILGCSFPEGIAWNARGITSGGHLFFYPRKKTIDVRDSAIMGNRNLGKSFSRDTGQKAVRKASVNKASRELSLVFISASRTTTLGFSNEIIARWNVITALQCLNFNAKFENFTFSGIAGWVCDFSLHRYPIFTNLLPRLDSKWTSWSFLAFIFLWNSSLSIFSRDCSDPAWTFPTTSFEDRNFSFLWSASSLLEGALLVHRMTLVTFIVWVDYQQLQSSIRVKQNEHCWRWIFSESDNLVSHLFFPCDRCFCLVARFFAANFTSLHDFQWFSSAARTSLVLNASDGNWAVSLCSGLSIYRLHFSFEKLRRWNREGDWNISLSHSDFILFCFERLWNAGEMNMRADVMLLVVFSVNTFSCAFGSLFASSPNFNNNIFILVWYFEAFIYCSWHHVKFNILYKL